jgi:hypothetical protein
MASSYTETTATLSNSASGLPAKAGRRGLIIGNPSDTAMIVRFGAAATATLGLPLPAGLSLEFRDPRACPDGSVSVFCAGASKAVTFYEW